MVLSTSWNLLERVLRAYLERLHFSVVVVVVVVVVPFLLLLHRRRRFAAREKHMFSFPFHRVEKRKTGRKRSVKVVLRNETSDDFEPPPLLVFLCSQ